MNNGVINTVIKKTTDGIDIVNSEVDVVSARLDAVTEDLARFVNIDNANIKIGDPQTNLGMKLFTNELTTDTADMSIYTGNSTSGESGGILMNTGDTLSEQSGTINIHTGVSSSGTTGFFLLHTGASTSNTTGNIIVESGNTHDGAKSGDAQLSTGDNFNNGDTGDINVTSGTAHVGNSGTVNMHSGTVLNGDTGAIDAHNLVMLFYIQALPMKATQATFYYILVMEHMEILAMLNYFLEEQ